LALIGGFCLHLTLGTLYCFGNLNTYITSYLRKNVHEGISYNDMVWVPTLATVSQGLMMTFSGHLEERIGVQFTIALGCLVMVSGVLLTAFTVQFSVVLTVITYGCMFGAGTALAYAPPLGVAMKWFPRSKGLVNGVIVGGFGLGAFIFNQIQTAYLNPHNHKLDDHGEFFTDEKILGRVPSLFLLLGALYAIIQAFSVLLIRPPPESDLVSMLPLMSNSNMEHLACEEANSLLVGIDDDDEEEDLELSNPGQDGDVDRSQQQNRNSGGDGGAGGNDSSGSDFDSQRPLPSASLRRSSSSGNDGGGQPRFPSSQPHQVYESHMENVRPGQMVKTKEFFLLWATFFLNTQAIGYINAMYKAYGQTYVHDDHFLSIVGAIAAIFNASGRVFWGNLCDAYGYRACMGVVSLALSLLFFSFRFVEFGGKTLFALWVWGIFFCFCANFVLLPTATAQSFGTKYSSKNYGLVMTGQAFAAPVTALLTEFVNPVVGWLGMFSLIGLCSLTSSVMNVVAFPRSPNPRTILNRLENPSPSVL